MKLFRQAGVTFIEHAGHFFRTERDWDVLVNRQHLHHGLSVDIKGFEAVEAPPHVSQFDPPIQRQEVWASGVTYLRSRQARVAESTTAGGGDFYDRVYDAARPELFFKSAPHRTAGHGGTVNIRPDSTWNVPEPELTLFVCSAATIEGYTIGNDMSSRSIEGENPLYLPQAKTYDRSAALGPCLYVPEHPLDMTNTISMTIRRKGTRVFEEAIRLDRMKRRPEELVSWLFRSLSFPHGCYLMTGTGIVPPDAFTLQPDDEVSITIEGIGTLVNYINQPSVI